MRIRISITQACTLKQHISIRATCFSKVPQIGSGLICSLQVGRNEYIGKIASINEHDSKVSINIKIERKSDYAANIHRDLLPYQYTDKELSLLVEEKVDSDLYKEAQILLHRMSQKTGKKPEEILFEFTAFKPGVGGRTDLHFVSEKQMSVVVDKIKERLSE